MPAQKRNSSIVLEKIDIRTVDDETSINPYESETKGRVSKNVLYCEFGKEQNEYVLSYFSFIIILTSIILDLYLLIKYSSDKYYSEDSLQFISNVRITLLFTIMGLSLHAIFVNRSIKFESFSIYTAAAIGLGGLIGALLIIIQATINAIKIIKLSVVPIDYLLFFISVAISEETLWRFGVQPSIKIISERLYTMKEKQNPILKFLILSGPAILITSVLFMATHLFVYPDTADLVIVFIMGMIFGISMEIFKRVDAPIVAHLIINIIAGSAEITRLFGGIFV